MAPPDGDMNQYMASLKRKDKICWPTHGNCIEDVQHYLQCYKEHRQARIQQILDVLQHGSSTINAMLPSIYPELDPAMYPAAARSIFAALLALVENSSVACSGCQS